MLTVPGRPGRAAAAAATAARSEPARPEHGRPAPGTPDRRPPLSVVPTGRERPPRSRRQVALTFAGAFVALCLFGVVVAHVAIVQSQFQLEQLRETSARKQADYDRLRLQVAELESPARIVADAQQRLGMVMPPGVTYLAPSQDDPSAPAGTTSTGGGAAGDTGWSTVKPHLGDG